MQKRVAFKSAWLPYVLVAPQIIITLIFFIWPASQALFQSMLVEDAFGLSSEFVWFDNFEELFTDPLYGESVWTTVVFSVSTTFLALSSGLLLAVAADRVIKGATFYKSALLWPYAVAPAVAGVLWLFMFSPANGIIALAPRQTLLDHRLSVAVAHDVLSAGGQRRVRLLRHLRHHSRRHVGRARGRHQHPGL
jgi:sn-glycerol 3-phosphate transport system permease protein